MGSPNSEVTNLARRVYNWGGDLKQVSAISRGMLVFAGLAVALFTWNCLRSLTANGQIWYEGAILGFVDMIGRGRLYQADALFSAPYSALSHTPLSYWADYILYSIWPALWPLRLLNMGVTTVCAFLVASLARQNTNGDRAAAWLSGGLFLICSPVFFWSQVARSPDAFECMFSLLALRALTQVPSRRRDAAVGLFWALAILSKQTSLIIMMPVLVLYDLFARVEQRYLLWRIATCAVAIGVVFTILQTVTRGGFLQNVVSGNMVQADYRTWSYVMHKLNRFLLLGLAIIAVGSVYGRPAGGWLVRWLKSRLGVWLVVSFSFALLAVAKRGADTMYFYDASAALAVMTGEIASQISKQARPWIALTILAAGFVTVFWGDRVNLTNSINDADYRAMQAWVLSGPKGRVLSDDAGLSLMLKQAPTWDDPFIFAEWAKKGRWDERPIVNAIRAKEYAFIAVTGRDALWTPVSLREIAANYRLAGVSASEVPWPKCIYVPVGQRPVRPIPGLDRFSDASVKELPCYIAPESNTKVRRR